MTVRTRVTAVAGLALTAALSLGLIVMYLVQVGSAHRTADDQLRTYATQLEQFVGSAPPGDWPASLPTFPLDANAQAQILAADGVRVLASTPAIRGLAAVFTLRSATGAPLRQRGVDRPLQGELRVVGTRADIGGHPVRIITWTSTDALSQINETFSRLLLVGVPTILLLACATVWLVVGRALRPVETLRRTVTDIGAADLSRRVPEPSSRDEIHELARTMNGMLTRLEDSAARQRRFVADASHELRSPLAAARTALEVGLAHPDKAPWPEIAERAVRQSGRLETLVDDLLLLARSDEGRLANPRSRTSVAALLANVRDTTPAQPMAVEFLQPVGATADADAAPEVLGDPGQLERMVRNIVDNAIRHARHRVEVQVVDDSVSQTVAIVVTDDGPGIPPADRERVFDRFVRLDESRDRHHGAGGLGLAIANEIATAHGGSITIDDAHSGGALVRVTLPRAAGNAEPSDSLGEC